ncbi:MAG: FecR family protein [Arcticibacter sp.]
MNRDRFKQLARKYFNDELTEEELKEFLSALDNQEHAFYESVDDEIDLDHTPSFDPEAAFAKLSQDERYAERPRIRRLERHVWTAVACSVLIMIGSLVYLNYSKSGQVNPTRTTAVTKKTVKEDQPDIHGAIRLADGTQLALADISEKEHDYKGVKLSRISENLYKVAIHPGGHASKLPYHEFSTGKGISYALLLPDGSKVDLNSGTTLKLNPGFGVSNRDCELSGEAYFDVTHNESLAFRVKTRDYDVKVLGTQFNVKSYPHNSYSQTALVKGNVHVAKDHKEVNLLPGDQVRAQAGVLQNKSKANLRDILAWKEGYFRFTDARIEDIMRDIMNWYAIDEIDYQYTSNESFTGSIVRTRSLKDVLESIEKISNLRFEIREGRVIVRK